MLETQVRMVAELERIREANTGGTVAVSHCDAIRATVMHSAGIPLDLCQRIEICPAFNQHD